MTKGNSLKKDLRFLINNLKYSDIEILCGDGKKLYGCRAILAARSEVFDGLLYNGMKESYGSQISFPTINSSVLEFVLEYAYTGSINEGSLTKDNIIETFYAADYFQLFDLQNIIIKTVKEVRKKDYSENYLPELLSKFVEVMPLTEDNILLNTLVEIVAIMPLNAIDFSRLSVAGLQYLLSYTHEKEKSFVTSEYEVFRYSAILVAKQVSNDAYKALMGRLPTLGQIENTIQVENEIIPDQQKIAKELKPLIKFIDFSKIKGKVLVDIIEPLEIIPNKTMMNIYRQKSRSNNTDLNKIRGIYTFEESDYIWDKSACGSKLIIKDNGKVVRAPKGHHSQSVRAKMMLCNGHIFEWDVIIEKICDISWIGVCSSEGFDFESGNHQRTEWLLNSNGICINSGREVYYCPSFASFGNGSKITVHLDMKERVCAFTVNGTKYPNVSWWNNLPSKLYPVVSLSYPGRFRIQPHYLG